MSARPPIPVTVITGHLGAGKTSAIASLLSHRPTNQRWAVIVNEFGELGVDGERLRPNADGLFLEEVTGACICCGMGAPLLFVLERMLATQDFDRLLIEPTGLAEPLSLSDSFTAPAVRDQLQRNAMICLVDMREAARQKWRAHATSARQVRAADILVGNFDDEASAEERADFVSMVDEMQPPKQRSIVTARGHLPLALLDLRPVSELSVQRSAHAVGAISISARMPATAVLERRALTELLQSWAPRVLRAKGFVRTVYGWKQFDIDGGGTLRWRALAAAPENRIELIAPPGLFDERAVRAALRSTMLP